MWGDCAVLHKRGKENDISMFKMLEREIWRDRMNEKKEIRRRRSSERRYVWSNRFGDYVPREYMKRRDPA